MVEKSIFNAKVNTHNVSYKLQRIQIKSEFIMLLQALSVITVDKMLYHYTNKRRFISLTFYMEKQADFMKSKWCNAVKLEM